MSVQPTRLAFEVDARFLTLCFVILNIRVCRREGSRSRSNLNDDHVDRCLQICKCLKFCIKLLKIRTYKYVVELLRNESDGDAEKIRYQDGKKNFILMKKVIQYYRKQIPYLWISYSVQGWNFGVQYTHFIYWLV